MIESTLFYISRNVNTGGFTLKRLSYASLDLFKKLILTYGKKIVYIFLLETMQRILKWEEYFMKT